MSQVEIVVTARNNAAAGLRAAAAQVSTLSMRLRDARMRAAQLAQAERDAASEVARLDRVVRFFGSAATEEMRDNLAAAQIEANRIRNAMADTDDEIRSINRSMGHANVAAAMYSVHIRDANRELERMERSWNRLDRRIGRAVGARLDRIGDSIRQMTTSAVTNALDSLGTGMQTVARYGLMFAAIGPAVAGLGVALVGVVGDLTGLAATLPAAFLAGAASLAVFKLGLKGVGEAFEAGLSGDAEKFKDAMKGLTVSARDFVAGGLMIAQAWKPVQRLVQSELFAGLGATIRQVNSNLQPLAEKWLPKIASLFNRAGRALGDFLKSSGAKAGLDKIFEGATRALDGFLSAVPHLAQAFTDIGEVGASMFGDFGEGFGGMAERFAGWIRELKESGELQRWADRAKEAFETLGRIAGDVGRVIKAIFKSGSDEGQTFLENIEKQTEAWATFMESSDGQKLVDSLGTIGAAMGNLVGLIQFLSEVWLGWVAIFESGIDFISRGWESMMQVALDAFGAIIDALVSLFGRIPIIGDMLRQAQSDFRAWRDSATNSINDVQGSINTLHGKTVYIDVIERKTMTGTLGGSGGYRGLASGGIGTGMKWVGEHGPELVDFGARGARVHNNGASREMARQGGGSSAQAININVSAGSGATTFTDFLLGEIRAKRIKLTVDQAGRVAVA